MIDMYSLKARIYPVVIVLLPVLAIGILSSIEFEAWIHSLSSLGVVGVLGYLLSHLGRDAGKTKERGLWEEWGGAPTTQLLRLTNHSIDRFTKARYHSTMQRHCPEISMPDITSESTDVTCNDETYRAWTRYLLGRTRDVKEFPLLFKENISYGFRRNLWALKVFALMMIGLIAVIAYFVFARKTMTFDPLAFPPLFWGLNGVLLVLTVFWTTIVKPDWVKLGAFSYANRLCEAIDLIERKSP